MRIFIRSIIVATIAIGVFMGAASAVEEEYEGASYCRDYPAWPNGTYLGQMHPYHSSFYTGYAEKRGWDPCETWATDQRHSAVRGLRELGHSLLTPEEAQGFTHTISGRGTHVSNPFVLPEDRYRVTTRLEGNQWPHDNQNASLFAMKFYPSEGLAFWLHQEIEISGHWERVLYVGSETRPKVISPIVLEIRYAFGSWSVTFERID